MEFIPVMIADDRTVRPVPYNGSAHIHAYTKAQGLVVIPEKVTCIDAGTVIDVMLF
jgi:molybdopterin biosynthesis enzyme